MFHNLPPCALVSSVVFFGDFYFLGEQFFFSNLFRLFSSRFSNVSKQDRCRDSRSLECLFLIGLFWF